VRRSSFRFALRSCGFAAVWTAVGCLLALAAGELRPFLHEWFLLQGFFDIAIGAWLVFVAGDCTPEDLIAPLRARDEAIWSSPRAERAARWLTVGGIAGVGTASLVSLGFHARSLPVLVFLWVTTAAICTLAALATWHGIELLVLVQRMRSLSLDLFAYSPAETRALRVLAQHVVTYAGMLTIGYAFTLAGTLLGTWTGPAPWVRAVRVFWPVLYVPFCMILLLLPQYDLQQLVTEKKDALLGVWEGRMNVLLQSGHELGRDEVDQCNALADLFEKVSRTPDYVLDVGLGVKTAGIIVANLATLLIPREIVTTWLRALLG
jgi:hypothetical protein